MPNCKPLQKSLPQIRKLEKRLVKASPRIPYRTTEQLRIAQGARNCEPHRDHNQERTHRALIPSTPSHCLGGSQRKPWQESHPISWAEAKPRSITDRTY